MASRKIEPQLTFRQLVDRVAREGLAVDQRPRAVSDIAKVCKVSRPHFYHGLRGTKKLSPHMLARIEQGLRSFAPWVTGELVRTAIKRTRMMADLNQ